MGKTVTAGDALREIIPKRKILHLSTIKKAHPREPNGGSPKKLSSDNSTWLSEIGGATHRSKPNFPEIHSRVARGNARRIDRVEGARGDARLRTVAHGSAAETPGCSWSRQGEQGLSGRADQGARGDARLPVVAPG
jgi:hypothetical protein